jgi:hypothetical protein
LHPHRRHGIAVPVAQRQRDRNRAFAAPKINLAVGDGGFFRVGAGLADFLFQLAGDDVRLALVVECVKAQSQNTRLFLQYALHDSLRLRHARRVDDGRVAKITHRVGLGAKTDFAGGE